jgi:hypothetical protein
MPRKMPVIEMSDDPPVDDVPTSAEDAKVLEGVIESPPAAGHVRYESRITIVDAFQYPGSFAGAPDWIDRNWLGFADDDPLRGIPAGPCLRVPSPADPNEVVLARVGDYVARQSVLLAEGQMPELRIEVWSREQFQKLFIPTVPPHPITGQPPQSLPLKSSQQNSPAAADVDRALDEFVLR